MHGSIIDFRIKDRFQAHKGTWCSYIFNCYLVPLWTTTDFYHSRIRRRCRSSLADKPRQIRTFATSKRQPHAMVVAILFINAWKLICILTPSWLDWLIEIWYDGMQLVISEKRFEIGFAKWAWSMQNVLCYGGELKRHWKWRRLISRQFLAG